MSVSTTLSANLPVHLKCDCAVDNGETKHSHPAEQDAPEGAWPEVHDKDLQRQRKKCLVKKKLQLYTTNQQFLLVYR